MGSHFPAIGDEDWRAYAEGSFIATPRGLLPSFDLNLVKTLEHVDFSEKIPALWPQFESLAQVPVLGMRGELSDLLSPRTVAAMAERHPKFEQLTVSGQGHAPLLRDAVSLERIAGFANRCDKESIG